MIESSVRTVQYLRSFPEISATLDVIDKRGQGTFASVFAVKAKDGDGPRRTYALKMLIPTVDLRRIENEIRILRRLGGKCNVIKLHTAWRIRDHVFMLMPFVAYIPFGEYYLTADENEISRYMRSLLLALAYIHRYRIIHRDIKPTNFLLDRNSRRFFLVDFGLAHSEVHGDVDDRWEADFESSSTTADTVQQMPLHALPEKLTPVTPGGRSNTRASTPLKVSFPSGSYKRNGKRDSSTPRLPLSPTEGGLLRSGSSNVQLGLGLTRQNSTNIPQNTIPGNCVCGFRLTVCRGCRQLPRLTAARRGGTLGFRPPEVMMRHVNQTTAVDVWAAGVIFLSFLTGRYPFIKVDDLDVLHAFTHLLSYERMQSCSKSLGRRLLIDPRPPPMGESETPVSWLKARCVAIRRQEKKFIGLPPLLSKTTDKENTQPDSEVKNHQIILPASHIFPMAAYDLACRMLEPNPRIRITASEALRHPFLQESRKRSSGRIEIGREKASVTKMRSENPTIAVRAQFC